MNMRQLLLALFSMLVGWGTAGVAQAAPTVSFEAGDRPGNFFTCSNTGTSGDSTAKPPIPPAPGCVNATAGQRSLAVIRPGDTVGFSTYGGEASTIHTALSLIWPQGAPTRPKGVPPIKGDNLMPFKAAIDFRHPEPGGVATVKLTEPGLYVFICDIHVYMFAGVIVDDDKTVGLDLGKKITLVAGPPGLPDDLADPAGRLTVPTYSDLAIRLLRTFFIVTDPGNWKDYTKRTWSPAFPAVPVIVYKQDGTRVDVSDLSAVLSIGTVDLNTRENKLFNPKTAAVGEIWVNTQFELTGGKSKPGTATAINGADWKLTKKVALPAHNMNHPHNMWTDKDQKVIYQTQWFDERVTVFERETGKFIRELNAGPAPSHVMTRANNDQVHVAQNGGNNVREFDTLANSNVFLKDIPMRTDMVVPDGDINNATHPHGHWMSADGMKMVTPNENVSTSTVYNFRSHLIDATPDTGAVPIATGMMPDSSKYYVANFLGHSISVMDMVNNSPTAKSPINLIANYDPVGGGITGPVGALPIQTPVSPDGTNMVTANTLTATITIVDTRHLLPNKTENPNEDKVVVMLPCDPGCHGVQYGAKALPPGDTNPYGQYYAYVASKFSNALIVVDPDVNRDGDPSDAAIVGRLLLAGKASAVHDDKVIGNPGMGGQGILTVPVVYHGWVQNLPSSWCSQLTESQRRSGFPAGSPSCTP
ncbi:MAG: copper oxidase [Nitrospira sp. LK70]|nr:copper oxidase [Nitrospira sp. LK70]